MKKTYLLKKEKVKVVKPLTIKVSEANGRTTSKPLIDKEGEWVQVEILNGPNKGSRRPVTLESLK